ncbi:MAG: CcoQ/FixQ family Cbb3-type cytochrome c oxidase assembly chaperone [Marinomonas sp.]|jgi:cytochrome c oxidase cbb3-type subunit 4|uniref:Cytochrome c oxidase cbb3-type subunit 4 n=1 Tax=Marinomonas communis TaxID=28254 RepID=A0A4R6XE91_9GAMM|nr:cbb3-type cytochrome c oxidase subunit 3 [Marinomonas communis]MAF16510.1 CcoQ/FixQ family Cbb3-type cytochrome c oxidase assembly chaperone [Marinomonas sp.]MEC8082169.1 cbb3-type cytochrome c oxidase subunit 3 [Pseudomonadota bacterium]MCC4275175.1 cbb3-type cytochrome c oxidase subunit 3 [Marinomonas communis]MEC8484451.1 cbb3-type cytochrome c oxidase subunit 3 [Pseudomonadota bacterium]RUM50397.1 MAG: CcoQ/FixQ family Cbb3-type cytochrome c oxidase assembly chaperone [Marinomonas sp.]|tara:strand:+ start:1074 stop:1262 length:189 start_codon:yes stop_codon:yes gene_type:complete
MDINTLRALATPIAFVAFIAIFAWTFSKGRKKGFEEAANLPFADDDDVSDIQRESSVEKNTK